MNKIKIPFLIILFSMLLNSCQAIGDIFQAGVWVGIIVVVVVIIILFAIFKKRN